MYKKEFGASEVETFLFSIFCTNRQRLKCHQGGQSHSNARNMLKAFSSLMV